MNNMETEFNKEWFANEIKFKRKNIPLRDCAKLIGTSPATLCRVESGKEPDITNYHKICSWLKMPMDKFFTERVEIPAGGFRSTKPNKK